MQSYNAFLGLATKSALVTPFKRWNVNTNFNAATPRLGYRSYYHNGGSQVEQGIGGKSDSGSQQ